MVGRGGGTHVEAEGEIEPLDPLVADPPVYAEEAAPAPAQRETFPHAHEQPAGPEQARERGVHEACGGEGEAEAVRERVHGGGAQDE